jgi:hypothetical protein
MSQVKCRQVFGVGHDLGLRLFVAATISLSIFHQKCTLTRPTVSKRTSPLSKKQYMSPIRSKRNTILNKKLNEILSFELVFNLIP